MPVSSFTHLTPLAFLERAAEVFADKTAIAYGDRRTSYSEFGAEATQLAHALRASGVQSGDRVAYMCPNIPEMLVANFGVPLAGAVLVPINTRLSAEEVRDRLAAVCPPGIEIQSCEIVRLAGHPTAPKRPDAGLGKLIDAVDVLIQPAADGMAHDPARLQRIAAALLARPDARIARGDKLVDVRPLILALDVIDGEAALKLCAALDWAHGPLLRARIRATAEGSAKPSEVAKALGVWGSDELGAQHALVARLGVVAVAPPAVPPPTPRVPAPSAVAD